MKLPIARGPWVHLRHSGSRRRRLSGIHSTKARPDSGFATARRPGM